MRTFILICAAMLLPVIVLCQARVVFNGGYIVLNSGAQLVVANPQADALTVAAPAGGVVSEGQNNNVVWMVGAAAGNYLVPFSFGGVSRRVSFTASGATGNGIITFSTYGKTDWKNSDYLPQGILNVSHNGTDNSSHVIDRFWKIDATGYTKKPTLQNLVFAYSDAEWNESGNTITEGTLGAQRWNSEANEWGDFLPTGSDNAAGNAVTVSSVSANNLYSWWTLVTKSSALPVQLLSFTATADKVFVTLDWKTATETNTGYFTVQKAKEMQNIVDAGTVQAAGNSAVIRHYSLIDRNPFPGTSFYRLKTTDKDGGSSYSPWQKINIGVPDEWQVFPNPATDKVYITGNATSSNNIQMQLIGVNGSVLRQQTLNNQTTEVPVNNLASGIYIIKVINGSFIRTFKIIKQ